MNIDPLDITADNLEAVWRHERAIIATSDPKLSPALCGQLAGARIINAIGFRAAEYIRAADMAATAGVEITEAAEARYAQAQNAHRRHYDAIVRLSGYRPGPELYDHPAAKQPLTAPAELARRQEPNP